MSVKKRVHDDSCLTPAQERYLKEITAAGGERAYNGRASGVLFRLRDLGYITVEWIQRPTSRLLIARLVEEGDEER